MDWDPGSTKACLNPRATGAGLASEQPGILGLWELFWRLGLGWAVALGLWEPPEILGPWEPPGINHY